SGDAYGLLAGRVTIEQKHDGWREALEQLGLVGRKGRAERCHDVAEPAGVERHDVEVPLDEDCALRLPDGVPRLMDPKQRLTLGVDGALGRVDVLRRRP